MLFVGLGNPGAKYQDNRHNVGFMAVEKLVDEAGAGAASQKFSGILRTTSYKGKKLYFFMPQTFMNCSGIPTSELIRFFKIPVEDVIVFHDELDLPVGKIRIKQGGGAGGHNGLKSLDHHIGNNYWRVRIGIDHPGIKDMVSSYVLSDFEADERAKIDNVIDELAVHLPKLVQKDMKRTVNDFALNTKV